MAELWDYVTVDHGNSLGVQQYTIVKLAHDDRPGAWESDNGYYYGYLGTPEEARQHCHSKLRRGSIVPTHRFLPSLIVGSPN